MTRLLKTAAMTLGLVLGLAQALPALAQDKVKVQWLGQAAFKITTVAGKVIVIDPWLQTNPKTPEAYRKLEALGKVDLVLVTHGHFDHMADAPALAKMHNAPLWAPAGLSQSLAILGVLPGNQALRMNKSGTVTPLGPDVKVTLVKAEHSSELVWKNPATGRDEVHVGGEPGGFVIEFENGFKLWHMGDTGVFGDMKLIADMYRPDLVLMPIGGGQFVMNPQHAAMVTKEMIRPKAVIPMHYLTNPGLPGTPADYTKALGETGVKVLAIQPGETVEF
ncbi:metal-dependent hydrolase [Rubrivivax sp. RP6-9]|uniref:metal-dependent hydrolase n=1 Tax=Rubrivivax sp. RP6-9 TaxID=3415750 RepID=UPI003CC57593